MEKKVLNEISQMKFLFGYKPGRVISEQELPEVYEDMVEDAEMEMSDVEFDFPEVAPAPDKEKTKEKETEERPKRRGLPSRNPDDLPNVDPHPQGRLRRMKSMDYDMPSSEEIEYELEIGDEPKRPMGRRMKDLGREREDRPFMKRPMGRMRREIEPEVEENIYEIEIDSDIEELFKK